MAHDFVHHYAGIHECRICSLRTADPARTVGACLSKPATPDAPEWKGAAQLIGVVDVDGTSIPPEQTKWERLGTGSYRLTVTRAAISGTARVTVGAPAPLDLSGCTQQAMADFTARRKAKRTDAEAQAESVGVMTAPLAREMSEAQERAFARALSTPLPHDPPMSVRIMPWRGKE